MKRLPLLAVPLVRLLLTQLLILAAVHAAPALIFSRAAGGQYGDGKAVVSEGVKDTGSGVVTSSGIDISRSRTSPITIAKIKPLTKTFGYLRFNANHAQILFLQATPSYKGRTPADPHRPCPAGRSP